MWTDTDSSSSTNTVDVVDYKYNHDGIRVEKYSFSVAQDFLDTGAEQFYATDQKTTTYLVDSWNHTGYAQTLEELTFNKANPDLQVDTPDSVRTYVIGDDVIAQTVDGTTQYLLYDGHGSTRQLAEYNTEVTIVDSFSYDGYGVLLQSEDNFPPAGTQTPGKVAPQATSLLYAGEQFDTDAQQYYLRARYYDQNTGRFNRMDPYHGSPQDPQSLHKYLYCHANPVNNVDPSGMFSFGEMFCVAMIAGLITGTIAGEIVRLKGGTGEQIYEAQWKWFWRGFIVGAVIYGAVWVIHSLWLMVFGGGGAGAITSQQAAEQGFSSHNQLVEAWRAKGAAGDIHHFVHQTPNNISNFGAKAIHSIRNSIPLTQNLHTKLHSYTQSSTTTLRLTNDIGRHYSHLYQYLEKLSWELQYKWGVAMCEYVTQYGSMEGFDPKNYGLL